MTTWIHKVADRIAGIFLTEHEAGACVPEVGWVYWKACGGCGCRSDGRWLRQDCAYRVTCSGGSVPTGATRCVLTQLIC